MEENGFFMTNALVLVLDGLGSSYLGPYGNTWIDTPGWNRLATRSLLLETMLAGGMDLASSYREMWQGHHLLQDAAADSGASLPRVAAQRMATYFISDDLEVADYQGAQDFEQRVILPPPTKFEAAADTESTRLAQLFATTLALVPQRETPFLIWVHASAMLGPWDAPYDLRTRFAAADDPAPPTFVQPPHGQLAPDHDPDIVLGFQQACAAQVVVLDTCLEVLLDAIWSGPHATDTALLIVSPRGYPLGEHLWVGIDNAPLHAELLHVPTLIHFPDTVGWSVRARQIAQPCDIYPTLMHWLELPRSDSAIWGRDLHGIARGEIDWTGWDRAVAWSESERAIRVPGWFARQPTAGPMELFVKPDDRWEVNNVANRCAPIAVTLQQTLDQFAHAARTGHRDRLAELPESLFNDLD